MYVIVRYTNSVAEFFGPFPTESRAEQYASEFSPMVKYIIRPLIVPNCVTVNLNY